MDKNFLTEHKLTEDVNRFKEIFEYKTPNTSRTSLKEYSFRSNYGMEEADDEQQQDNQQQPPMNAPQGQMDAEPPQGQQPQMGPDMNGGQPPMQPDMEGGNMDMMPPQQPMGNEQMPSMDDAQMPQEQPIGPDMGEMSEDNIDTEEMESNDEVIDVDDLTHSQEETENKVDVVDDRLTKLLKIVNKYEKALEASTEKLEALKTEFEKRNPTEEEKLNIRSQSSYPYSESPRQFWDNLSARNPNYNVIYDNDVPTSEEDKKYVLRKRDIDGFDMRSIADTLNVDQKLSDYLDF